MGKRTSLTRSLWLAAAGAGTLFTYITMIRPWMLWWGLEKSEEDHLYTGDEWIEKPLLMSTRAITVHAPTSAVWPWLVQIGYQRGGFYSYDLLENLIGLGIQSAGRIQPNLQTLTQSDCIYLSPVTPMKVVRLEPEKALILYNTMSPLTGETLKTPVPPDVPSMQWSWAFLLDQISENRTRLIIRVRAIYQPIWLKPAAYAILEPIHFLMEQKMLRTIKERAEALAAYG